MPAFARVLERKARVAAARAAQANRVRREQGLAAALKFGAGLVRAVVAQRRQSGEASVESEFDRAYGTDTSRKVKLHGLDIRSPNYRHAIYYEPSSEAVLDEAMSRLPISPQEHTFIDYGSGKGLVVLRAAGRPFRRAIGVEFARELWETALRNRERHPASLRQAPVDFVLEDAADFTPPEGPLVLYLYEPFEPPVTEKVLARIAGFVRERNVWIVYAWSKNREVTSKGLWDAAAFLTTYAEGDGWTIYTGRHGS